MSDPPRLISADDAHQFVMNALCAAGTAPQPAQAVSVALTETSLRGVDSHGIRLLPHYVRVVQSGRINPTPTVSFEPSGRATGVVNGDNGFGHYASYIAIDRGIELASEIGVAAISVINSSHFGAAGCYVLRAASQGLVAFGTCNSDSLVLPHDGTKPFYGTNPLAFAAPVHGERPFLMDMATSAVPWNRVLDLRAKKLPVPPDVSVDSHGQMTIDAQQSSALLPLGGLQFGYKGAALASMAEVLSAVMTGMPHCSQLLAMSGPDNSTPRHLGHFFIVIDPTRFLPASLYDVAMARYLSDLRSQPAHEGKGVMAPGDREWAVERERQLYGIPVNETLERELEAIADLLHIPRLRCR